LFDKLSDMVKSMSVFLNYREKYFGIDAIDEKDFLDGYAVAKDKDKIVTKLNEYKKWWGSNKTVAISLTTIPFSQKVKNWWRHIIEYMRSIFKLIHRFVAGLTGA